VPSNRSYTLIGYRQYSTVFNLRDKKWLVPFWIENSFLLAEPYTGDNCDEFNVSIIDEFLIKLEKNIESLNTLLNEINEWQDNEKRAETVFAIKQDISEKEFYLGYLKHFISELFPEKINGKYAMLSRPSDNGHTPFGDIFISYSPDMKYWGEHRCVMKVTPFIDSAWQCTKIGAGAVPIKTKDGWLLFYHGVINTCNGFRYSMGAALLDLNNPSKVIARTQPYLLAPATLYETTGDVPNVVFPCAALHSIEEDKVRLVSLNDKYDDIIAPIDEVRIVGLVTKSFRPISEV